MLDAGRDAVAMQDLNVSWSSSWTGPSSGKMLAASASPNTCPG